MTDQWNLDCRAPGLPIVPFSNLAVPGVQHRQTSKRCAEPEDGVRAGSADELGAFKKFVNHILRSRRPVDQELAVKRLYLVVARAAQPG